jgi:hypothetical protein
VVPVVKKKQKKRGYETASKKQVIIENQYEFGL